MIKLWSLISGHAVLIEMEGIQWARYSVPDLPGCHADLPSSVVHEEDIIAGIQVWKDTHQEYVSLNIPPYVAHMEGAMHVEE